jgi:hypothetical protein
MMKLIFSVILILSVWSFADYTLEHWGPYKPVGREGARALDLVIVDRSGDMDTLVIAGFTSEGSPGSDRYSMTNKIRLYDGGIVSIWLVECHDTVVDDDSYGLIRYLDDSSNERFLSAGFHNVDWPPNSDSIGSPDSMGLLSVDINSSGSPFSFFIHEDVDWVQEASAWDVVEVPDLSDFGARQTGKGFAACGWFFESDPDTSETQEAAGLIWLHNLHSYASYNNVIEDDNQIDVTTWDLILYDDNSNDPLIVVGGMHNDGCAFGHRLGILDNDDPYEIKAGYWIPDIFDNVWSGPLTQVSTCEYVMVGDLTPSDNQDDGIAASYWSYNMTTQTVALEDTLYVENGSNEPLDGFEKLHVFASALDTSGQQDVLVLLLSATTGSSTFPPDSVCIIISELEIDVSQDTFGDFTVMDTLFFTYKTPTEIKGLSFDFDSVAPVEGLGTADYDGLGNNVQIGIFRITSD